MNCNDGNKLYDFSNEIVSECKEHSERVKLAVKKLAEYEDLEEQGLLVKLPCKVGDVLYSINEAMRRIYKVVAINRMIFLLGKIHIYCDGSSYLDLICCDDIGKTVFLTKEEAEQALKYMESEE